LGCGGNPPHRTAKPPSQRITRANLVSIYLSSKNLRVLGTLWLLYTQYLFTTSALVPAGPPPFPGEVSCGYILDRPGRPSSSVREARSREATPPAHHRLACEPHPWGDCCSLADMRFWMDRPLGLGCGWPISGRRRTGHFVGGDYEYQSTIFVLIFALGLFFFSPPLPSSPTVVTHRACQLRHLLRRRVSTGPL